MLFIRDYKNVCLQRNNTLDFGLEEFIWNWKMEKLNNSIILETFVESALYVADIIMFENQKVMMKLDPVYDEFQMELNDGAFN